MEISLLFSIFVLLDLDLDLLTCLNPEIRIRLWIRYCVKQETEILTMSQKL